VALVLAIPSLPIATVQNMVTKTWLFSTRPVPSIVYFARIGTIAVQHYKKAKSLLKLWLMLLMSGLRAYATLAVTPHLSCLIQFVWPGWLYKKAKAGFSASAGRPMAQCTPLY
jgi:hypothetical protein